LRRFFATTPAKPHASLTTDHDQTTGITTMKRTALLAAILTFALAGPALAHTGAGTTHGFAEGFGHPFSGADHILAMVCVGLWAALLGGRATWIVPAAFVVAMAAGGVAGAYGIGIPFVEAGILASIVILGLLVAFNVRLHVAAAAAVAALFAVFHGHAHGAEMPVDGSGLAYGLGFMLASAILHGAGLAAGIGLGRLVQIKAVRAAGAFVGAGGAGLALLG
jgi:urease accessory protein